MKALLSLIEQHKQGRATGIYSVCSAHPLVLEAAIKQATQDQQLVLIEATSNQVNQFGGYTGMTPQDFSSHVLSLAERLNFPAEKVVLGGDHLGPNCWQNLSASQAMEYSAQMIHDYVCAGFKKIHLDCSMPCADDQTPLSEEIMAQRAAQLCVVAEQAWRSVGGEAPVYVIGTEVPTPGGALESLQDECIEVTQPEQALATLDAHHQAFSDAGLGYVWPRVIGLVVQPGVEFDHHMVHHYQSDEAQLLSKIIDSQPHIVFEAHSTDYQNPSAYRQLVNDHFAILKVGPALTYALREALFALSDIENVLFSQSESSNLKQIVLGQMLECRGHWEKYYSDNPRKQLIDLQFSLSDRIRYYWSNDVVTHAVNKMMANLNAISIPLTMLSQYLPKQFDEVVSGNIENKPKEIILNKIMKVIEIYNKACVVR
ncbi:D-tagatose-bisphosphate aldolase, class II, non-catalytic subunit [Vibrio sp. Hep-1b-8]|uniref:D-tagatose-bisphosphate aldolase, class II, non-catalytic subunit n=1 Tax=Vibrio sp. Hep-1b-8 TaxID=2144187 RepID=UPI0011102B61|nr:D-tagatose-bisphosphate aldolase, class II, non-catalytic subunit [Vibrio sp. Hep-1b-8]TMX44562.1 D-tagatose-bisphosphate aldolase, class II, non-catalytic subunit [Vibrio sp. Hep-1b-8]